MLPMQNVHVLTVAIFDMNGKKKKKKLDVNPLPKRLGNAVFRIFFFLFLFSFSQLWRDARHAVLQLRAGLGQVPVADAGAGRAHSRVGTWHFQFLYLANPRGSVLLLFFVFVFDVADLALEECARVRKGIPAVEF
jgi:hypothetical protein